MNVTCPNCASVFRVDPSKIPDAGVRARCSICSAVFAVRREGETKDRTTAPSPGSSGAPAVHAASSGAAPSARPAAPVAARAPVPSAATAPAQYTPSEPVLPPAAEPPRTATPASAQAMPTAPAVPAAPMPPRPAVYPPPAVPQGAPRPATPPGSGVPPAPVAPATPAARPAAPMPPAPPPAAAVPVASPSAPPSAPPRPGGTPGSRPVNPFLSQDPALKARRLARALISDMVVYHPTKRQDGLRDGNLKELFDEEIRKSWEEYAEQVGKDVADSTPYFKEALNEILAGGRQIF